jgi:pimeloyl-ACP methyl ester carboxylesterase
MDTIFSVSKGNGHPVLLLHGFCETHEIWNSVLDKLSLVYRMYCPDLPGFGQSPLPEGKLSIPIIATLVINWIEKNNIHNLVVIGHSLGGYVALEIAKQRPHMINGVGLFHSTAKADTEPKKANRDKVVEFVSKNGAKPFLDSFVPTLFYRKDNPKMEHVQKICSGTNKDTIIAYSLAMRDRSDYQDSLANTPIPILFVSGAHDSFIPTEDNISQANLCKNPQLVVMEETNHIGMIEDAETSLKHLQAFLIRCF